MKLHIKYNIHRACRLILHEQLNNLHIPFTITSLGNVELGSSFTPEQYKMLEEALSGYGITIIDNPRNALVQQIKDLITALVYEDDKPPVPSKMSTYVAGRMNLSYSYLSKIFSDETYSSIENFMILMRIERVKELIIEERMTFSEVAWKLNYSSVAHLSNQFKKITGLTPTQFQKIIERRLQKEKSFVPNKTLPAASVVTVSENNR